MHGRDAHATKEDAVKTLYMFIVALSLAAVARAEIKTQTVEYKDGDTTLKGFLAYDDAAAGKRPGIVVVPEWWGLNEYPKSRAEQLAKLGYVAFAADIYGEGFTTMDPKVAGADIKVIQYPDAKHAFTNPNADKVGMDALGYNKAADEKSWQDMQAFLKEIFGGGAPQ